MWIAKVIACWFVLCGYFLIGSAVSRWLDLPLSGAICGMLLLLFSQFCSRKLANWILLPAQPVLQNMTLFFIPAVLGVVAYTGMINKAWLALVMAIVVSTIICLGLCGLATQYLLASRKGRNNDGT
ncbi:CidA/LrgA family protein [Alteromonas sediminis]|uniref:CidA/LrgA family protein n=1 Tax=Alteromonas sediminis TaxID=2259342 RepID=A0A3N5ZDL7_9ALTE|nr:CidA/LrgA family protein [Alteromonas sediminis]RPJ68248.1 CidA/LrgA family protein [Alteromonas sediminis]